MKGFLAFAIGGLVLVALSAVPPEHARWIVLALLVLVVLTPAVGQSKPRRRAVPPREEKASSALRR